MMLQKKIATGKIGDNASGCSAENSLIVKDSIYDSLINNLIREGGQLVSEKEKERLQNIMWKDGRLSREIVAKPVEKIAELAEIELEEGKKFLMVGEFGIGKKYPFSGEKMSLVLTLYSYDSFREAVEKVNAITSYSGVGHSCGIHSTNEEHINELAEKTKTTKVLVRQAHGSGNSGSWTNGLAKTFSLGCGTWGGNIVSENITQKHYMNTTWLSYPIDSREKENEEIFGPYIENISLNI
jgi:sulfoacetaldehyde dehydrogenase